MTHDKIRTIQPIYLEGAKPYPPEIIEEYTSKGWWENLTYGDLLDRAAAAYPDKPAVIDSKRELTFGELKDEADRLAIAFLEARPQEI